MLSYVAPGLQAVPIQPRWLQEQTICVVSLKDASASRWLGCRSATFRAQLRCNLVLPQKTCCHAKAVRLRHDPHEQNYLERLLHGFLHRDVVPSVKLYRFILKACADKKALAQAKLVHAHLAKHGLESSAYLSEHVVITYVKCGGLVEAFQFFERLPHRSIASWAAIISGYTRAGQSRKALTLYQWMREEGVHPNAYTLVSVLKACGSVADLESGRRIHAETWKYTYEDNLVVQTCLVDMYGKCGSPADAQSVFDRLPERDIVAWNAMLAAYAQQSQAHKALQLYVQLREEGVSPNARTFVSTLQAHAVLADNEEDAAVGGAFTRERCLGVGKEMHADMWMKGFNSDVFVGSTLICMYGKCGSIVDAQNVFEGLFQRDVVIWNAMLAACVDQGQGAKALKLYEQMQEEDVSSNSRTFVSVLQACENVADAEDVAVDQLTSLQSFKLGRVLHAGARSKGYSSDLFVSSTLISMYSACGSMVDAQTVFNELTQVDVVAWTALLVAYVEHGEADKALKLYEQMREEGVSPNSWTYVAALQACGVCAEKEVVEILLEESITVKCLEKGKAIHGDAWAKGYDVHPFVSNSLVTMYGKCGSISDASNIFEGLSMRDVVSWNAMLMAYVQRGQSDRALQLFGQMQEEGSHPDETTIVWALQACSKAGCLEGIKRIHQIALSASNNLSPFIASTLIITYGRCASMADAQIVFDTLQFADVVSWNALIASYAREGDCLTSLRCYEKMQAEGMHPNGVTFLSLLSACSHAGLLDEGLRYFESMSNDYGISPGIEHYVCLVDLLGRAGCFTGVEEILSTMPVKPNLSLWLCLLGSCQKHGQVALGKQAFDCAVRLQPKHPSAYLLMSNVYADAGLWDKSEDVMQWRQVASAWKYPGQSWIEYEKEVHTFMVRDSKYLQQQEFLNNLQIARQASCSA